MFFFFFNKVSLLFIPFPSFFSASVPVFSPSLCLPLSLSLSLSLVLPYSFVSIMRLLFPFPLVSFPVWLFLLKNGCLCSLFILALALYVSPFPFNPHLPLSLCLSVCLCLCLSVCLSVCLSLSVTCIDVLFLFTPSLNLCRFQHYPQNLSVSLLFCALSHFGHFHNIIFISPHFRPPELSFLEKHQFK